jgi:alginate O-acetyltransferase complex protein AlgI
MNWWAANFYATIKRGAIIVAAIAANLAVLGVCKYANFFAGNVAVILDTVPPHFEFALPLGISFFTFHHIMYLVDLRRRKTSPYPLDRYALHICFFPQVISGLLVRWYEVMAQFGKAAFAAGYEKRWVLGFTFIVLGLVEKVLLGDGLAPPVGELYERLDRDLDPGQPRRRRAALWDRTAVQFR